MTEQRTDRTGAPVSVDLRRTGAVGAYTVSVDDGTLAGRADFVDTPRATDERVFFHTEVDAEFGGRGLAGLLVREALADSIRRNLTVVPVCPLFARHLERHGDEYRAEGGRFRRPRPADLALVEETVRNAGDA
ncbi:GNAT family N-acetyltransferase [Nocardiopsis sp. NPDC058789]|uniref:N-acetyltransferase n=1 Tax=Nocardiopsis eucommiae TaxID=2831970 RepID=A0A975QJM8_9ACTN|nr:N-acetyltransferase [Nocardiopsis eucommiae]